MMRTSAKIGIILVVGVPVCVCFLFGSCALFKEPVISPYQGLTDDAQVLSIVFDSLCGNEEQGRLRASYTNDNAYEFWKQMPKDRAGEYIKHISDSLHSLPDSLLLEVCINDSTLKHAGRPCEPPGWEYSDIGPQFNPLVCSLNKASLTPKGFNKELIHSRYPYRLLFLSQCRKTNTLVNRPMAGFSEIMYNSNKTLCCLESALNWGLFFGVGDLWFLKKIQGDWVLIKRLNVWYS